MDPKRKRLYIILLAGCIIASLAVFLWGRNSSTPGSSSLPLANTPTSVQSAPITAADGTYIPPSVFPANKSLDMQVLSSSVFKTLQTYQPVNLNTGDLGRDNPFKNYGQ